MENTNIIKCKDCKHCFKCRRSKTGYACEMWGYDDFADSVPLDGWCFKAKPASNPIFVKYDKETRDWFDRHPGAQTTVACCEKCGLYYKPDLGHKCKKGGTNANKQRNSQRSSG